MILWNETRIRNRPQGPAREVKVICDVCGAARWKQPSVARAIKTNGACQHCAPSQTPTTERQRESSKTNIKKTRTAEAREKSREGIKNSWTSERRQGWSKDNSPNWKGGRHLSPSGYVLILNPSHPRANVKGYVLEHVLVAEEKIGNPLEPGQHVHHINEIKTDNRPENLMVVTNSEHRRIHNQLTWEQLAQLRIIVKLLVAVPLDDHAALVATISQLQQRAATVLKRAADGGAAVVATRVARERHTDKHNSQHLTPNLTDSLTHKDKLT